MPPNEQTVYPSAIWQMVSVSYLKPAGSVTVSYLQAPWRLALGHLDSSGIDYWSAPVTSSAKSFIILMIKCALICLIIRFVFNMCLVWWSITVVQSKISQHAVEGLRVNILQTVLTDRWRILLTVGSSTFSSGTIMKLTFVALRAKSQQLLDGLPWIFVHTFKPLQHE